MAELDPKFLGLEELLEIHKDQIDKYGGSHGVRDMGLLQSAIAMPMAQFGGRFLHGDLFEMGAAYLFHIVQNHPFVDGNKRTGAAVTDIFLAINGIDLKADEQEFEKMVMLVGQGKADKTQAAKFLRDSTTSK